METIQMEFVSTHFAILLFQRAGERERERERQRQERGREHSGEWKLFRGILSTLSLVILRCRGKLMKVGPQRSPNPFHIPPPPAHFPPPIPLCTNTLPFSTPSPLASVRCRCGKTMTIYMNKSSD
jgi:hypothetical protein